MKHYGTHFTKFKFQLRDIVENGVFKMDKILSLFLHDTTEHLVCSTAEFLSFEIFNILSNFNEPNILFVPQRVQAIGYIPLVTITGINILATYLKSSHCNSFEEQAPVDFIYRCPIFKWVAETWIHDSVSGYSPSNGWQASHPLVHVHSPFP